MTETPQRSIAPMHHAPGAAELLPEVYSQLERVAAARLAHEKPGQTMQPTALVHEAWLRIAGTHEHHWQNRAEFIAAAAQAMRRILVENARLKKRREALEGGKRVPLDSVLVTSPLPGEDVLALDESLDELARQHPAAARLVQLRFFIGLKQTEAAEQLGISRSSADRLWLFARSWLYARLRMPGGSR
jgi:RNA polymerase sigma factor (TIGR02999 family)